MVSMTSSVAREVVDSDSVSMSNTSWSTITPSALCPSTSARRIRVGAIDTPSTSSTAPPTCHAYSARAWEASQEASMGWRRRGFAPALRQNLLAQRCTYAQSGEIDSVARQRLCWRRRMMSELRFDEAEHLVGGGKAAE